MAKEFVDKNAGSSARALLLFAGALFLTGCAGIPAESLIQQGVSPAAIMIIRPATTGAVFFMVAIITLARRPLEPLSQTRPITRREVLEVLAFGTFGVAGANGGTTLSVAILPDAVAIPAIFAAAIFTAIVLEIIGRSARIGQQLIFALSLAAAVYALCWARWDAERFDLVALAVPIATGACQGLLYRLVGTSKLSPWTFFAASFTFGAVVLAMSGQVLNLFQAGELLGPAVAVASIPDWILLTAICTVAPYSIMRLTAGGLTTFRKAVGGAAEPVGGVSSDAFQGATVSAEQLTSVVAIIALVLFHQRLGTRRS